MGLEHSMVDQLIVGDNANIIVGRAIRTGGQAVDVHGIGPVAARLSVEVSNDGYNFIAATDADGAAITLIAATNWYREIRERPEFVRGTVAAAAANGSEHHLRFGIHKQVA